MARRPSDRSECRNQVGESDYDLGAHPRRYAGNVKHVPRVSLRRDKVAIRYGDAQPINVEDVIGSPLRLAIPMRCADKRDSDVGARHRIDKPTG
jgi:hypothetical protein